MLSLTQIPQIVGGTVPAASKQIFDMANSIYHARQLEILVTAAGGHASFVATVEGSHNRSQWFNLVAAFDPNGFAGLTIDENGIAFASAIGTTGLVLPGAASFKHIRLGLAGNAAASGTGMVIIRT